MTARARWSTASVQIDGVKPACLTLSPEEIFFRAVRNAEFDICELSLSSFTVKTGQGGGDYVGVPAFVSRAFRHTSIYVRTDRIKKPEDLRGKRVGMPEYQLTANVWARAILQDDYGVKPSDIHWIRGGIEDADRPEKISITLPKDVKLDNAPAGKSISALLAEGAIDGFIAPRPPSLPKNTPNIGWLFPDPVAAAKDYYKRTGIFPIMHIVGVRRTLAEQHPWLPGAVFKAFEQAKAAALAQLSDTWTKVTLPSRRLGEARALMGEDFWIRLSVQTRSPAPTPSRGLWRGCYARGAFTPARTVLQDLAKCQPPLRSPVSPVAPAGVRPSQARL